MFEIWIRAITRPRLATYQELLEEETNPSLGTALLWLAVLALQAAHRFTVGRAVASVLVPLVFLGIPLCVIGFRFYVGAI